MQRNFILTDVMKTGRHEELEQFIACHSFNNQTFDCTGEYFTLQNYDLDSYDRRFAIIDVAVRNSMYDSDEFNSELKRRLDLLHSQNFVFIRSTVWESKANITAQSKIFFPKIDVPHVEWLGGVSFFWFHMYNKDINKKFNFCHDDKEFDFLYLNKGSRSHRNRLYYKMKAHNLLENSLFTFRTEGITLPAEYELPGIDPDKYPRFGLDQDIYEPPYNDTKFSIVSETNDTNDEVFMTEKIWKPILAQHLFVVHGNHLYLQKLREMGFKTFSSVIDESYDLQSDQSQRIKQLVSTCKKLKDSNWRDLYLQTQAIRKHNLDTFFDREKLSKQVNETLELFLEFADGGQVSS